LTPLTLRPLHTLPLCEPVGNSPMAEDPYEEYAGLLHLLNHNIIPGVGEFLDEAFKGRRIEWRDKERAPCSLRSSYPLLRFLHRWSNTDDMSNYKLVFHGTSDGAIEDICRRGLDPEKRRTQAKGAGEYFAIRPETAFSYAKKHGSNKLILCLVLMESKGVTYTSDDVVCIHAVEQQLPLFVVHVEQTAPSLEERNAELEAEVKRLHEAAVASRSERQRAETSLQNQIWELNTRVKELERQLAAEGESKKRRLN